MIPSTNSSTQVRFNYINTPLIQAQLPSFQNFYDSPIKIEDNIRNSSQKFNKLEGSSFLQLETRKNIKSQNKISQMSVKDSDGILKVQSTVQLQNHQPLQKAQKLDPVPESTSLPTSVLQMQSVKDDPPKFKFAQMQQIRQSDFFNNNNNQPKMKSKESKQSSSQPYNSNPYSNLNLQKGQNQNESGINPSQRKRVVKQIKTFKIDKIQEKKESEFTGCCGFGLSDKITFFHTDK